MQAGKDVYVEKPVSHNIYEGRKLVETARKYNRVAAGGTQRRWVAGLPAAAGLQQQPLPTVSAAGRQGVGRK
jgi:predicted dehydrogenase